MKTLACLTLLCLSQIVSRAQPMFGSKTEGGGPGGSPGTNCPCWRFPVRVLNNRVYDLRPLFGWWRDNYGAYQSAVATARAAQKPPDFSALTAPPMPGWHRIKEGHFVSPMAYGWLCDVVIEDYPAHTVSNRIILYNPPKADQAAWDNLVAEYQELQNEPADLAKPNRRKRNSSAYGASADNDPPAQFQKMTQAVSQNQYPNPYQNPNQNQYSGQVPTNAPELTPKKPHVSRTERVFDELKRFPEGTNYTIDLFAIKLGYLQDGSHRQVYDLGQIRAPSPPNNPP